MKKLTLITLILLLTSFKPFLYTNNNIAQATLQQLQGDLIINNSNVIIFEGNLNINGSIIIEENATLIIKNAILNFTQTRNVQYNITLCNPKNGNPTLRIENATIHTNNYKMYLYFYSNSSAKINKLTAPYISLSLQDHSNATIENSVIDRMAVGGTCNIKMSNSLVHSDLGIHENPNVEIFNSTIESIHPEGGNKITITNSTIEYHIAPRAYSANLTINQLKPDFFKYWNFKLNCSVTIAPGGKASNITIKNTQVNGWILYLKGLTNAKISRSRLKAIFAYDATTISIRDSSLYKLSTNDNCKTQAYNTTIQSVDLYKNSKLWLTNSKDHAIQAYGESQVYVAWLIKVHVTDSINQNVPLANVTATYQNTTIAAANITGTNGTTTLKLIEKIINTSEKHFIGIYTIEASYETHTKTMIINITESKEVTLKLENFVIPEFQTTIVLLILAIATVATTLLTTKLLKRKEH